MLRSNEAIGVHGIEIHRRAGFRLSRQNPGVLQDVGDSTSGDIYRGRTCRSAAAKFCTHKHLALILCSGVVQVSSIRLQQHQGIRRTEGLNSSHTSRLLIFVIKNMGSPKRQKLHGLAAGVNIDHIVGHGQQGPGEIVGDDLGNGALRIAGKHTVHVAAIDPGSTLSCIESGIVHRRHDDHPAAHLIGVHRVGHTPERYRTFVLIAVIRTGENCCRTTAVLDHGHRHHDSTPGRVVSRIGHFQESVLYSILFEIHR